MKRLLAVLAILPTLAFAAGTYDDLKSFDPALVTSGTAGSMLLDVGGYTRLTCTIRTSNEAGGASHVWTPACMQKSAGTLVASYSFPATTVVTNSSAYIGWDPQALVTPYALQTGQTVYGTAPCRYMRLAAPAANGITQISCAARK